MAGGTALPGSEPSSQEGEVASQTSVCGVGRFMQLSVVFSHLRF